MSGGFDDDDDESSIYSKSQGGDDSEEEDDENEEIEKEEEDEEDENEEIEKEEEDDDMDDYDEEDNDDYLEARLKKISKELKTNIIKEFHTELNYRNVDEIELLAIVSRNANGDIIDPLHKTLPILTKYEKTRILGERARQIEEGSQPLIDIKPEIIDSYVIAEIELKEKAIPFILERPLPNGGCEYWRLADLEYVI
jgi:DNA-directed RNA polymerase subunit K/omega